MSYQPPSNRVRTLWQGFVKSSTGTRNATEHKIRAATAKADEGARAGIAKDIQEKSFRSLRTQWQSLLDKAGLNDADWIDITEAEKEAVITILGEVEDDDECPASSQMPPTAYPYPLAPSFSSSTRSTNISNISSASSYAVVSPNELYSEDDGDPFMSPLMASSNDTSEDDEEVMVQPVFYPGRRAAGANGWSSSESLHHHSMESSSEFPILSSRPLASGFAQNTYYGRMSSAAAAAAAASATSLQSDKEKAPPPPPSKSKTARQPYIGPRLEDPNEPISEAEDFERFKMQTRMEKIVEFHQAAALAEIRLSFAIYRSRKASPTEGGQRQQVSPLVLDHQKSMVQLQSAKEEERKTIVKRERSKRRSELRGRSNTLIAPTASSSSSSSAPPPLSTNPSWLNGLEGQASSSQLKPQFDLDTLVQKHGVQGMFSQFFPEPAAADASQQSGHAPSSSRSAVRPPLGQGFSSASMQSGVSAGPSGGGGHHAARKRRPSDVRMMKKAAATTAIKGKGRPSLFGDDDSSDEGNEVEDDDDADDDQEEEEEESPPTARNPFMDAQASEMLAHQLHGDFELQQTMARLGLLSPPPPQAWTPSSRLMEQPPPPPPVAPSPMPWMTGAAAAAAAKEVPSRSTATPVVASGWTTRKNTPAPSSSASSFRNPFGGSMLAQSQSAEPSSPPRPPSTMPAVMMTSASAKAKGKQAMMMNSAASEPQPIWGSPHINKKASPPPPPPSLSSADVSPPPAAAPVPVPPQVVEKPATPAPAPVASPAPAAAAAASKKMNKKQRQAAAKKGGPSATTPSTSNVMEEPESTPSSIPTESTMEDHPSFVTEPPTTEQSLFSSPISRMMGRSKIDSSGGAGTNGNGNGSGFGFGFSSGWDTPSANGGGDAFSTPRPASKIPSHLQHLQNQNHQESFLGFGSAATEGITPRAKKNPMVELFGLPLNKTAMEQLTSAASATGSATGSSTIRAAHQQQPATTAGKSLWNMFSSEPAKPAQPSVAGGGGGGDPWFPGGFSNGNAEGGNGGGAGGDADADGDDADGDDGWGDDGGGGGGEVEVVEEEKPTQQPFWKTQKTTGPFANSKMMSAAAAQKSSAGGGAQGLRRMSEAPIPTPPALQAPPTATAKPATPAPTPVPVPAPVPPQPQATATAATNKKGGKGKKGKGKKVTIEEVPDDEDKNVEHLPVDSRVILEPSPQFSQVNLDSSAVSLGGGGEDEMMMMASSVATSFGTAPSTAASSQSDLFGAGGGVGWGAAVGKSSPWGSGAGAGADSESQGSIWGRASSQPKPVWGQMGGGGGGNNNKDKGKGKMMTDSSEQGSNKIAANPTMKRSKAGAGGKLF